jgi:dihydroorotate dehydrogenase
MQRHNAPRQVKPIEVWGIPFPNAVGLAAGMDKNARIWRAAGALGFGFVEIGTVTQHKQSGNDRPRMFRYPDHEAILNRMGFNNDGAEAVAARLKKSMAAKNRPIPLGVNLGKSKVTPLDQAASDYLASFHALADYADYFAINVSSPNTPGLRDLQGANYLPQLLRELVSANRSRAKKLGSKPKPMLLKVAPDLTFREIDGIIQTLHDVEFDGIIATNTTIAREGPMSRVSETGGISGRPLHRRACEVVKYIHLSTSGKLPIIGVGGIDSPESAGRMVDAGATLVQIYSGMVYKGPFLAKEIAQALAPRHQGWI